MLLIFIVYEYMQIGRTDEDPGNLHGIMDTKRCWVNWCERPVGQFKSTNDSDCSGWMLQEEEHNIRKKSWNWDCKTEFVL